MPPALSDQESTQQNEQRQPLTTFRNSDHAMGAYGKLLLRWANTPAVRDFYLALQTRTNIWRVVNVQDPLPTLSLTYTPTRRSLVDTNPTYMLSRLLSLGISLHGSTAVDSQGSVSLPEQVPLTYASSPSLALHPSPNSNNDVPDVEMEEEPSPMDLEIQRLTAMLDLEVLAKSFGPRALRNYLHVFNENATCLVLKGLVGFASTYLVLLMFIFGNGWCSADALDGQIFTLAAFHASYSIHHARIFGKILAPWHQLDKFAEFCTFRVFVALHFITESATVSLRASAQVAARGALELLVLTKWHVFNVEDVGITAGQVKMGAEALIEEMLAFLKNPSGALIEVEGKAPQPGPLHTVLTSFYADFFFRGPASLKKKANALAAYWEPFWPAYKAANPGTFEGFPNPVNAFVNINLVPFKHHAPIGGFTMLFTAFFTAVHELCTTAEASPATTLVTKRFLAKVVQKIDIEPFQPFNVKAFDAIQKDEEYKLALQKELNGLLSPLEVESENE